VPLPSHLAFCTPTKCNLYFDGCFDTVTGVNQPYTKWLTDWLADWLNFLDLRPPWIAAILSGTQQFMEHESSLLRSQEPPFWCLLGIKPIHPLSLHPHSPISILILYPHPHLCFRSDSFLLAFPPKSEVPFFSPPRSLRALWISFSLTWSFSLYLASVEGMKRLCYSLMCL
jgi:hypothetical protein